MRALAVAFTIWTCPGAVTVLGIQIPLARLPEAAKPALGAVGVCQARPVLELYDPARAEAARARVRELGRPAQLYQIEGIHVGAPLVDWKTVAEIKETP